MADKTIITLPEWFALVPKSDRLPTKPGTVHDPLEVVEGALRREPQRGAKFPVPGGLCDVARGLYTTHRPIRASHRGNLTNMV